MAAIGYHKLTRLVRDVIEQFASFQAGPLLVGVTPCTFVAHHRRTVRVQQVNKTMNAASGRANKRRRLFDASLLHYLNGALIDNCHTARN